MNDSGDAPQPPPPPPRCPPAGKVPVTLYDRWATALNVDGVAFGKRVRAERERNNWTLEDLHQRTGVPVSTLGELEGGKSARPRVALWMTLAQALGFETPGALLGLPEAARPPGTHPDGPRKAGGGGADEDTTVQSLAAQLLRGLWQAQADGRAPRGRVRRVTVVQAGVYDLDEPPAPAGDAPGSPGAPGAGPPPGGAPRGGEGQEAGG